MKIIEPRIPPMDFESVVRYINTIPEIVGTKWLARKRKQKKQQSHRSLGKYSLLYQPSIHPLIEWTTEYIDKWWPQLLETNRPPLSQNVLKLAILGESLEKAKHQKGFERLINRLKRSNEFDSAAFEVEVAAAYIAQGYTVKFVEEGNGSTPDLKVTTTNNEEFWVECKRREPVTKRDKRIVNIWKRLETALLSYLVPNNLNYLILVSSKNDPDWDDIDNVKRYLFSVQS